MLEATHGRLRVCFVRELEAEVVHLITPYFRKCLSWSSESRRESGQLLMSPSDDDSRGVESGIVQDLARQLREFARLVATVDDETARIGQRPQSEIGANAIALRSGGEEEARLTERLH